MTEQDEPPLPEPLDIEGELQILPVPRPLVTLSFEEIRQMLYESIRSHLATVRTPLYPAIALPFCVILPLASRGVSSLTVNGVGRNVSLYGFLPGSSIPVQHVIHMMTSSVAYLSGRVEACVLYANRPLDELWEISERLRSDVSIPFPGFYHSNESTYLCSRPGKAGSIIGIMDYGSVLFLDFFGRCMCTPCPQASWAQSPRVPAGSSLASSFLLSLFSY